MTAIASDTFTASNGTNLSGYSLDNGLGGSGSRTWTIGDGLYDIQSNKAHPNTGNECTAYVDIGQADNLRLTAPVEIGAIYNIGILCRYKVSNGDFVSIVARSGVNQLSLVTRVGGVYTVVADAAVTVSGTHDLVVEISGNNYTATYNGATLNASSSVNSTETNFGLRAFVASPMYLHSWLAESISSGNRRRRTLIS